MKAIRIHETGGPEVLEYEEVPDLTPGASEALVKVSAIGVNFIDIYHRSGLYKVALPFTPGMEAAGIVESIGAEVTEVQPGDRVAYAMALGAYAEYALVPSWKLVSLPERLSFESGAAVMLQGMTAHYLTHTVYPLETDDACLIHAAAGGVGLLLVQMAKRRGARVIGTVSTEEKAELARAAGADEVVLYTKQDFETEVKRFTEGQGVEVVYDSVGQATWEKSLDSLGPRGYLVFFGNASGPVPPIDPLLLSAKGSIFLARPTLATYTSTREELLWRANDVLDWVAEGELEVRIDRTFPLSEAAEAQTLLESRQTAGKLLLKP